MKFPSKLPKISRKYETLLFPRLSISSNVIDFVREWLKNTEPKSVVKSIRIPTRPIERTCRSVINALRWPAFIKVFHATMGQRLFQEHGQSRISLVDRWENVDQHLARSPGLPLNAFSKRYFAGSRRFPRKFPAIAHVRDRR